MNITPILFAISGLLSTTVGTPPWPYQHISKESGLSNSAITAVYMDSHDYVWFGSWDGLNRYDGSSIKIYKPDAFEKTSISNNVIRKFLEDKNDNLWVVTHQGINRYDRDEDHFNRYFDESENLPFTEYSLHAVLGPDSNVWISLRGQGLSRYNDKSNQFEPVQIAGVEETWMKNVLDIGSSSGLLYMLGNDGNLVCSLNGKVIFTRQLGSKRIGYHQFVTIDNKSYIAVSSGEGQLSLYSLTAIETNPLDIKLPNAISSISETRNGSSLWVGTELGDVYKLSVQGDKADVVEMSDYFPQFAKAQRKILTMTETSQDILWIGTDGDGIYKFLARTKPFTAVMAGNTQRGDISNSIVRSVYEDNDGTLYIGTRGGGLNIIDASRKETKVINTSRGLSNNTVLSINKDKLNNIWIGVDGEGIDMIERRSGRIYHFPRDFENKTEIAFNYVYSICIDAFGDIWLGTSGNGVIQMKVVQMANGRYKLERHNQISHYASATAPVTINSNIVYSIVEETPNILWFGTRGAGIYRYNSLANKIEEHYHTGSERQNRLVDNDVLSLHVSKTDELWIGTSGGVNRLGLSGRPSNNMYYTQRDGLPNNTVHGILSDKENRIWLSTNNGLVVLDPDKKSFKSFDVNDGLQNNEFTDGAFYGSHISGDLFFGGINGLDVIHPDRMDTTNYFSKLVISEFQVHNMMVTAGDSSKILAKHVDATSEIVLAHDQNFISFHFTTLDYWNKQRTGYAYFLENFDKAWNYIGQQSVVNLTNIPPGEYVLHINYSNKNNQWSPSPKTINIRVTPPFWRSAWAYGLYIMLLVGAQVGVVLIIRQRARVKRAAAIDKFKIQQMQELNDYKLRFFTNVAHEFRTPLTLIFGPVISLIKKSTSLWERNQLKTIYNNSLRLQKLIDELIQFRKIESGKEKLEIAEVELIQFTHEIVDSFQQYAAELDVNIDFIPPSESLNGWGDSRKLEKVLINLISNAIKYNTKDGHVEIVLNEKNGVAEFIIRDTGIGIAEEMKEAIFESFFSNPNQKNEVLSKSAGIGLSLTRSLVHVHKGTIHMESQRGTGSSFTIRIPITRDAYQDIEAKTMLLSTTNLQEKISQEFGLISPAEEAISSDITAEKEYTLLVVDDNEQIIVLLQSILSDRYKIVSATNGEEALRLLDEERIDLVISDVLMTKMDGLALCRNIKDNIQTSHIPVILLTAKAEIEDRIEGLQVGADSYIPKPFHPEHLFIRIERLIRNREQIRTRFGNISEVELESISTGIGEKDDAFFSKITQCIMEHLSETDFSADTIAEEVGMSKTSLYKKVKAITGLTPHGLIKQYRLKKAADLLKNSNMSVSAVIYETGFNSRSYFYKSFNEVYHCHPKDFGGAKAG